MSEEEYAATMRAAVEKQLRDYEEAVQHQKNKALTRLETRKPATLDFTPSSAYYISGHGLETLETFIVPPNCVVIVKATAGEPIYNLEKYMQKICQMKLLSRKYNLRDPNTILSDPFSSYHMSQIIEYFGSVAVYKPGDICPNFTYTLTACYDFEKSYKCFKLNSGLLDISKINCDQDTLGYRDVSGTNITSEDTKSYVKNLYKDSEYPVIEQIEEDIRSLTMNQIKKHMSFLEKTKFFNGWDLFSKKIKILVTLLKSTRITQSELCKKFTGVFYNFVCRTRGDYTNIVYGPPELNLFKQYYTAKPRGMEEIRDLSARKILHERIGESLFRRGPLKNFYASRRFVRPKFQYLKEEQDSDVTSYSREEPTESGTFRRPRTGHWKVKEGGTRRKTRKILTVNRSKKNRKVSV